MFPSTPPLKRCVVFQRELFVMSCVKIIRERSDVVHYMYDEPSARMTRWGKLGMAGWVVLADVA
jgi:hypothetical protein